MTINKAIKIWDWWIAHKKTSLKTLLQKWEYDPNNPSYVEKLLMDATGTELHNLELIKFELIPKCNHPKKMIDTLPDGKKYCMNCNFDLD